VVRKAASKVVSAVLTMLIILVIIAIIIIFVVPFSKEKLSKDECLKIAGVFKIVNDIEFTCFTDGYTKVQIYAEDPLYEEDIYEFAAGFGIVLEDADESKTYVIIPPTSELVNNNLPFDLPKANEKRTYTLKTNTNTEHQYIKVYPILNGGKTCDIVDSLKNINRCT